MTTDLQLIQGLCEDVLKTILDESVDMVFADPPFNVGKKYAGKAGDQRGDYYEWCAVWIAECYRVLKPTGTFYHMTIDRHLEKLFPLMGAGVFVNLIKWQNRSTQSNPLSFLNFTQPIFMYGKTDDYIFHEKAEKRARSGMSRSWSKTRKPYARKMIDYWNDISAIFAGSVQHAEIILEPGTNKKAHLAQAPMGLTDRCIRFSTDEGATILDPFNGSGTTGASCIKLDRNFIGIEPEQKYIDLAEERWSEMRQQLVLL